MIDELVRRQARKQASRLSVLETRLSILEKMTVALVTALEASEEE